MATSKKETSPDLRANRDLKEQNPPEGHLVVRIGASAEVLKALERFFMSLPEYLNPAPGRPNHSVLEYLRRQLRHVELIPEPIRETGHADDQVRVLIHKAAPVMGRHEGNGIEAPRNGEQVVRNVEQVVPASHASGPHTLDEAKGFIAQLEEELDRVNEQLNTMTRKYDVLNEAVTASNGEVQSINEELTSTTEELGTSKEELQSRNEELLGLNADLETKIGEIRRVNSDLHNLMDAAEVATIFLDRDLTVQRYTPQVPEFFDIGETDVGRPLIDLTHRLGLDDIAGDVARALRELTMVEREVKHTLGERWFLVRYRPYHGIDNAVEGVVITFVDITQKKKSDDELKALVGSLEHRLSARGDQIKELASELLIAELAERQRIAQILHDDLQQLLYAFQMRVGPISSSLPSDQALSLVKATELIDRAMDVTRILTVELSPPVLKSEDVGVTIDWLALRMKDMHNLHVEVSSAVIPLPPEQRTLVYLVTRELLFNVVKHAGTNRARLNLVRKDNMLVLVVEDSGAGYDAPAEAKAGPTKQGGFGLGSIRQRLEQIGGHLEMESTPGEGTRATLFLPLDQASDGRPPTSRH